MNGKKWNETGRRGDLQQKADKDKGAKATVCTSSRSRGNPTLIHTYADERVRLVTGIEMLLSGCNSPANHLSAEGML